MATDFEGLADELLNKYIKDEVQLKSVLGKEDLRVFLERFDQRASDQKGEGRKFSDRFINGLVNTNAFGNILSETQEQVDPTKGMPIEKFLKKFETKRGFQKRELFYRTEKWSIGQRFVLRDSKGHFVKNAPILTEEKIKTLIKQPRP